MLFSLKRYMFLGFFLGLSKEKRRHEIADDLRKEVMQTEPSRLLSLITQGLKFQQLTGKLPKGTQYDLLRGDKPLQKDLEDKIPKKLVKTINVRSFFVGSLPFFYCAFARVFCVLS